MKQFFKISFLLVALFIFSGVSELKAQKIAVVDTETLLAASPEMKRATSQLEAMRKQYQKRLEAKQQRFNARYSEIMELASQQKLTQQQELTFTKELQQMQNDLMTAQRQYEKDLLTQEEKIMKPVLNKLKTNITNVAKAKGYRYVFNKDSLIYYPPGDDITTLVKQKLGYK